MKPAGLMKVRLTARERMHRQVHPVVIGTVNRGRIDPPRSGWHQRSGDPSHASPTVSNDRGLELDGEACGDRLPNSIELQHKVMAARRQLDFGVPRVRSRNEHLNYLVFPQPIRRTFRNGRRRGITVKGSVHPQFDDRASVSPCHSDLVGRVGRRSVPMGGDSEHSRGCIHALRLAHFRGGFGEPSVCSTKIWWFIRRRCDADSRGRSAHRSDTAEWL